MISVADTRLSIAMAEVIALGTNRLFWFGVALAVIAFVGTGAETRSPSGVFAVWLQVMEAWHDVQDGLYEAIDLLTSA